MSLQIIYVDDAGAQRSWRGDATLRVQHEITASVTDKPVENTTRLTDHVEKDPILITAEIDVTNTPIEIPDDQQGAFRSLKLTKKYNEITKGAKIEGGPGTKLQFSLIEIEIGARPVKITPAETTERTESTGVETLQFDQVFDRVKDTFDLLDRLAVGDRLLTAVTRMRTYDNMILQRVSVPEEPRDAATFTLEFRQVRVEEVGLVEVVPVGERRAESKTAKGAQATYELDEQEESALRALL
jgi:hypothetical protein